MSYLWCKYSERALASVRVAPKGKRTPSPIAVVIDPPRMAAPPPFAAQGQAAAWGKAGALLGKGIGKWWKNRGQDDYGAGGKYEGYHETDAGPMGPKYEG